MVSDWRFGRVAPPWRLQRKERREGTTHEEERAVEETRTERIPETATGLVLQKNQENIVVTRHCDAESMKRSILQRLLQEGLLLQACRGSCWVLQHSLCAQVAYASHLCRPLAFTVAVHEVAWATAAPAVRAKERHRTSERSFERCAPGDQGERARRAGRSVKKSAWRGGKEDVTEGGLWSQVVVPIHAQHHRPPTLQESRIPQKHRPPNNH